MANEAVILSLNGAKATRMTCSDGVAIEKGTILRISATPFIVAPSSADAQVVAGIASEEKVANDGRTSIGVYRPGCGAEFDLTCGLTGVTLGTMVQISGANLIGSAIATSAEAGKQLGQAMETGAGSEVIRVIL
jgi:hypothetical protein